jgi:hypothetical protein
MTSWRLLIDFQPPELSIFSEFDLQDLKTSASECLKIRSDFLRETQSVDSAEFCLDLAAVPGAGKASLAEQVDTYYLQHHESLYRFLISVGCPVELVPDLMKEGFCRRFENLHMGKEIERPRSWLVRVQLISQPRQKTQAGSRAR